MQKFKIAYGYCRSTEKHYVNVVCKRADVYLVGYAIAKGADADWSSFTDPEGKTETIFDCM